LIHVIELRLFGSPDLRQEEGREAHSVLAQPKRLAVLAWLVMARPLGFHRRDTLLASFWPELDAEHARAALRKTVYHLRQSLGSEVVLNRGDEEIGAGPVVWCDANAFQKAIADGRARDALALYRGDLLEGFFLSDVPEFEHWLEAERERLRRQAAKAAWDLVEELEVLAPTEAAEWARRGMELAPQNEAGLRRLLVLLRQTGEVGEALGIYEEYRGRLADLADVDPAPETQTLVSDLRRSGARSIEGGGLEAQHRRSLVAPPLVVRPETVEAPGIPPGAVDAGQVARTVDDHAPPSPPPSRRRLFGWAASATVLGVVIVAALTVLLPSHPTSGESETLAVGLIRDFGGAEAAPLAEVMTDLLATNLSRVPELRVVSPTRIHEILARRDSTGSGPAVAAAARKAGAVQLIEGALYRRADGGLRLDLRRVRLSDAAVLSAHTVEALEAFSLVDLATVEVLRSLGISSDDFRVADVTTRSLVAFGFHQQGLRAYYRGELSTATGFFDAALEEDSTFAMAAYHASLSTSSEGTRSRGYLERALQMLQHATPRERLLIRARWADLNDDPARLAIAETLAIRYPVEPEGHFLLGRMHTWAGDFEAAIPRLWATLAMDSSVLARNHSRCGACDALAELVTSYALADSLEAAERVARDWLRRVPGSLGAMDALAKTLEFQGQLEEAMDIRRRAAAAHPDAGRLGIGLWPGIYSIRAGDWETADRFLRMAARTGGPVDGVEALWYLTVSLRYQSRYTEALEIARQIRAGDDSRPTGGAPPPYSALTEAIVLFEMGQARQAAALWDSLAAIPAAPKGTPSQGRHRAWMLTHAATAHHAAGDTAALKRLIPRIQTYGARSAYGRDPRLHHHARGLLFAARNDDVRAVEEFRRAVFSTTGGYTRTNLELARALLRLGRPREAIPVLQAAFRGPLQASNLYVTHTELHEHLGRAYEMEGRPDSAAVHRCWVARAREVADTLWRGPPPTGCPEQVHVLAH
jgi:DNA-binding SARP family transcriptional activator/tetratricopeptide (TPR) repeat protein